MSGVSPQDPNSTPFESVFWKEYRVQSGLWKALSAAAVALQIGSALLFDRDAIWLINLAMAVPAFYALGCAAVSFAGEREEQTHQFLRFLPVSPESLLEGKVLFAVVSTVAMVPGPLAFAWLIGAPVAPPLSLRGGLIEASIFWSIWAFGFLVWGVLFSLLAGRVLHAICLGAAANALVLGTLSHFSRANGTYWAIPALAVVALVDVWLAGRWLDEPRGWRALSLRRFRSSTRPAASASAWDFDSHWARRMRRLMWKERRDAIANTWIYAVLATVLCMLPVFDSQVSDVGGRLVLVVAAVLLGVCVFRSDQSGRRYRFLNERGISPLSVWLAKQFVWTPFGVACLSLCVLADVAFGPRITQHVADEWQSAVPGHESSAAVALILLACSMYGLAQLFALLTRNTVIAAALGTVSIAFVYPWHFALFRAQVPYAFSVAPAALFLLLTIVRVPDWLRERNSKWSLAKLGLIGSITVFATLFALDRWRGNEIADAGPGFSIAEYRQLPSIAAVETADLYQKATASIAVSGVSDRRDRDKDWTSTWFATADEPSHAEGIWLHARPPYMPTRRLSSRRRNRNENALAQIIDATHRTECSIFHPVGLRTIGSCSRLNSAHNLILFSARELEFEGKLDEALERYEAALRMARHVGTGGVASVRAGAEIRTLAWMNRWIGHHGQTPEMLARGMQLLEGALREQPAWKDQIKADHVFARRKLNAEPFPRSFVGLRSWSEWQRALRVVDAVTRRRFEVINNCGPAIESGTPMVQWQRQQTLTELELHTTPPWQWYYTSAVPPQLFRIERTRLLCESMINLAMWRRATLLRFALAAYRLDYNTWPDSLDEMAGTYLESVPRDPWSGADFEYRASGFPHPLQFYEETVDEGRPLLWSVGSMGGRIESVVNRQGETVFQIARVKNEVHRMAKEAPRQAGVCVPFVIR